MLISRVLPIDSLGLFTLGMTISLLLVNICILGLGNGMWRFVAAYNAKGDIAKIRGALAGSVSVAVPFSLLVATVIIINADFISTRIFSNPDFATTLRLFVLTVPLLDRKSTRLNSSHIPLSRMPSSA